MLNKAKDWGLGLFRQWVPRPPPQKDVFQQTGQLSPDQFRRAGQHLVKMGSGWQWKSSQNKSYKNKNFDDNQQYLLLQKCFCRRRLNTSLQKQQKLQDKIIHEGDDDIVVLDADKIENYRLYKMYIQYDQYYHTPRMYFSATHQINQTPVTNQQMRQDIQKQYLDKTLTVQNFKFLQGVRMPTVHPCRHAAVLKTMSDSISQNSTKIQSHFALLIFLKFISSVIPYVEFDTTGDLIT